ncbi:IS5 family transposase [Couchioplanes caeruleus]|uniref:IS5 family transposase n=1 Tax=Couchioplanes caeruleus TaxID=56438 RepID=UPI001B8769CE
MISRKLAAQTQSARSFGIRRTWPQPGSEPSHAGPGLPRSCHHQPDTSSLRPTEPIEIYHAATPTNLSYSTSVASSSIEGPTLSVYLVTGTAAPSTPATLADHLPTSRPRHYPSDTSDAEWQVLAPHIPAGTGRGRPIIYPRRDIVHAIRYLDRTGCQWDALPADFPHPKLVYHYLQRWTADGTLTRMHNHLREQVRQQVESRNAQPTAALVDSQSLRGAETVARASRGSDAGKKINGRKRHIAVDSCGLLLAIPVTGAGVQDRDGARPCSGRCTPASRPSAPSGPTPATPAKLVGWATDQLRLTVQIVAKLARQTTFIVLHRRWAVERTFSWINRCRRTVRDYERLPQHHAAMVQWAMIIIMTRRLARHRHTRTPYYQGLRTGAGDRHPDQRRPKRTTRAPIRARRHGWTPATPAPRTPPRCAAPCLKAVRTCGRRLPARRSPTSPSRHRT